MPPQCRQHSTHSRLQSCLLAPQHQSSLQYFSSTPAAVSVILGSVWRARACLPLLCFYRCLDSNPESCRCNQARCKLSHPPISLPTFPPIPLIIATHLHVNTTLKVARLKYIGRHVINITPKSGIFLPNIVHFLYLCIATKTSRHYIET